MSLRATALWPGAVFMKANSRLSTTNLSHVIPDRKPVPAQTASSMVHRKTHLAVFQAYQQTFSSSRATDHLDVADERFHLPFPFLHSTEGQAL